MPTEESLLLPSGDSGNKQVATIFVNFNIEKLRFFAMLSLSILFFASEQFSRIYIFYPLEGRSAGDSDDAPFLSSIFGTPWVHMEDTYIYQTFGFPHSCSWIDFNPAKEIGAILLPLFQVPMVLYLILSYYRIKIAVSEGTLPERVLTYSKIATPFTIFVAVWTHMWFVNDPELGQYDGDWNQEKGPKGYGFPGHYLFYALFQIAMAVIAAMQVIYLRAANKLPFNAPDWSARAYVIFIWVLTIWYQALVISFLVESPIVAKGNPIFEYTALIFKYISLVGVLLLSFLEMRNGDSFTLQLS